MINIDKCNTYKLKLFEFLNNLFINVSHGPEIKKFEKCCFIAHMCDSLTCSLPIDVSILFNLLLNKLCRNEEPSIHFNLHLCE